MRIGIVIALHGREGDAPTWRHVRDQVLVAEAVGFDLAVIEDALLGPADRRPTGYWESVSMAGALAAATSRIEIGHSVVNAPYRSAGLTAKAAETLDEISGGRFFLGIGLGNTLDYEHFGIPADRRYTRFAETIQIIHRLLRTGRADFDGTYQSVKDARMAPRGPRPGGPPIVIAAQGPKMLRLAARYADGWNWWGSGTPDLDRLAPIVAELDRACDEVGRDPSTLQRSLDVYSLDPIGRFAGSEDPIGGTPAEIAETLLRFGDLGFEEIRVNVFPVDSLDALPRAIEALGEVVELLHAAPDREPGVTAEPVAQGGRNG
ncbi:MAG: LLM class flavin-dependent oxidoreductase [Chloroflexi bacterium]|nr:LLM class flavin-dependent oxidoreductase [Chloroflexota bacterium]